MFYIHFALIAPRESTALANTIQLFYKAGS